jgi:long-subunit acyl-CoA synthetase (AMP-forming)
LAYLSLLQQRLRKLVIAGYLEKPEETAAPLDMEGWLHTGDIVYFDNEGSLYIVDRIKELIKCKGFQVFHLAQITVCKSGYCSKAESRY